MHLRLLIRLRLRGPLSTNAASQNVFGFRSIQPPAPRPQCIDDRRSITSGMCTKELKLPHPELEHWRVDKLGKLLAVLEASRGTKLEATKCESQGACAKYMNSPT